MMYSEFFSIPMVSRTSERFDAASLDTMYLCGSPLSVDSDSGISSLGDPLGQTSWSAAISGGYNVLSDTRGGGDVERLACSSIPVSVILGGGAVLDSGCGAL